MPVKFNEIKQGEAIIFNNEIWIVFKKDLQTRGNLRSYYQVLLKNLERGNVYNQRFSPEDNVEQAVLIRNEYEYLYMDGDMLVLMDPTTYDQINLHKDMVPEDQQKFLLPNIRVNVLTHGEKSLRIEMPQFVEVEITDTPDAARGDTATSVFKLATIETGAEVKVPGHIKKGDKVKIRVEDGEFLGRIN
ncbi:MAG TPA: elongation factor P [Planctomycetota bacterium]|nr:elongation factor P [Planctomycetota bacterium]